MPTNDTTIISDYAEKAQEALQKNLITEARYEEILVDADLQDEVIGALEEPDVVD